MVINSHPLYQLSYQGIWVSRGRVFRGRMALLSTTSEASVARLQGVAWAPLADLTADVIPALTQVLGGQPADSVIDRLLRAHRAWSAAQRTAAVEAVFGVGLWRRRLAWHAGVDDPGEAPASTLLACLLRDLAGMAAVHASELAGLLPGTLPPVRGPPETLADRYSVPDWLAAVFEQELGGQTAPFLDALNRPGPITLRTNLCRITRDALLAVLKSEGVCATPAAYSPLALHLDHRPNIFGLACHRQGLFDVQDEGSQLLGLLVGAKAGDSVLDLCAGAGGKTLLLASAVGKEGTVWAYDSDFARLERLRHRAKRAGASNVRILWTVPESLRADRVLVDAPCSSLGALRRGPDLRFRIDPASLPGFPPLQRRLLEHAQSNLKPGGVLVYGTCTLRREENEDVVASFLGDHPEFYRVTPTAPWLASTFLHQGNFRCLPHLHGTDGFFGAILKKAC